VKPIEVIKLMKNKELDEIFTKLKSRNIPNIVVQHRFLGCSKCRDWTEHDILAIDEFRLSICKRCGKEFKEVKVYGEWVCLEDLMQFLRR